MSLNVWSLDLEAERFQLAFALQDPAQMGCLPELSAGRAGHARGYLSRLVPAVWRLRSQYLELEGLRSGDHAQGDMREEAGELRDFLRDVLLEPRYFPLLERGALPSWPDPSHGHFCQPADSVSGSPDDKLDAGLDLPSAACRACLDAQIALFRELLGERDSVEREEERKVVTTEGLKSSKKIADRSPSGEVLAMTGREVSPPATSAPARALLRAARLELQLADIVEFTALWAVGPTHVSAFLLDLARC
jgi:hypothetical protein